MSGERRFLSQATVRFATIGLLILAMLIPLALVEDVSSERQAFYRQTQDSVARSWGLAQALAGPFIVVAETRRDGVEIIDGEERTALQRGHRVLLPETLTMNVELTHSVRRRAIYEVPVYTASIRLSGRFPAFPDSLRRDAEASFGGASFVLGLTDTRALVRVSEMQFGDEPVALSGGTGQPWLGRGLKAALPAAALASPQSFTLDLELKGTEALAFTLLGASTEVQMTASWPHPSFRGDTLPDSYELREDGFEASWTRYELARELPAHWFQGVGAASPLSGAEAAVQLFQPFASYRTVDRAIKYGILFISLTYLTFLCFELVLGLRFHPVQYGVVGAALVLFYLTLLSLSEHLPFALAYGLATALLSAAIGGYVQSMTASKVLTGTVLGIMGLLYGTLFVLLKLEAFALLAGTGVLFLGLLALMFSTRSMTTLNPAVDVRQDPGDR
ncbi:MAG: cell envelope integrity protein CreD [Pseudomonadota bacterium]